MAEKGRFYSRKKRASGYSHFGEFTLNYDSDMTGHPHLARMPDGVEKVNKRGDLSS